MSFAYLPLYTGDYIRDTQHLSLLEHGAYVKLLMYCWDQQGPAPNDERKLMGICNARSKEEISAVYSVLNEYFIKMDDGFYNNRLFKEIEKAEVNAMKAKERGKLSAEARRQKFGTAQPQNRNAFETLSKTFQKEPESDPNPPTPTPTPTINTSVANATVSSLQANIDDDPRQQKVKTSDIEEVMKYMNTQARRNYRAKNPNGTLTAHAKIIYQRLKEGYTARQLRDVIGIKSAQWMGDEKMDQYLNPATLFRPANFLKYLAEADAQ